jgi:hypothetical protein
MTNILAISVRVPSNMVRQIPVLISARKRAAEVEVEVNLRPTLGLPVRLGVGLLLGQMTRF